MEHKLTQSDDPRIRILLEAPLAPTLFRMALPNVLVMASQAAVGLIETYFVGKLGTPALAGVALVFPVFMLMQMMSAGAIGGGIASTLARARGARDEAQVASVIPHALLIALILGATSSILMLALGKALYGAMGGQGEALQAAMRYSSTAFGGAVLVWLFNALSAVLRGRGNMAVPAYVTVGGLFVLVPLSPALIFGWGPLPALGIAGGAVALLAYYALGTAMLLVYMGSSKLISLQALKQFRASKVLLRQILGVGLLSAIGTLCTNASIMLATAFIGQYGVSALAGYGTASRLEYLMVPVVFGFGSPLLAIVGTCIGAGKPERAVKAAWTAAAMVFVLTEAVGLLAATFPGPWLSLFTADPAAIETGSQYLRVVAPFYGLFGVGLVLYFGSQGAGRMQWPIIGNLARVVIVALGGWALVATGAGITWVYALQVLGLVAYCAVIALSVARGAWFTPLIARVHFTQKMPARTLRSLRSKP